MRRTHRNAVAAAFVLSLISLADARAQSWAWRLDPRLEPAAQVEQPLRPAVALLSSAVLPGAGQFMLGEDRWVPFVALEAWAWITFFDRRRESNALAREYRDLAWFVARRPFTSAMRRDTIFEYYEAVAGFAGSGLLDSNPQVGGIQPEPDVMTYNGDVWQLARALYFRGATFPPGSPEYTAALQYYLEHAIPASFAWAWTERQLERQSFQQLIRRSDEAYRAATQVLGVILVNHVVSAIDALVLARLRGRDDGVPDLRLESGATPGPGAIRWTARLRVRF